MLRDDYFEWNGCTNITNHLYIINVDPKYLKSDVIIVHLVWIKIVKIKLKRNNEIIKFKYHRLLKNEMLEIPSIQELIILKRTWKI